MRYLVPWPSNSGDPKVLGLIPGVVDIWATTADPATTSGIDRSPSVKDGFLIAAQKKTRTTAGQMGSMGGRLPSNNTVVTKKKGHEITHVQGHLGPASSCNNQLWPT